MTGLYNALNLRNLPEFDHLMVYMRVTSEGDYEGVFSINPNDMEDSGDELTWRDMAEEEVFESELIEPIVFEDTELGYLRVLHRDEAMFGQSSRREFAPLTRQLASFLLAPEAEDYRRSLERSTRILEWLEQIRNLAPRKFDWLGIYFHEFFFADVERGDLLLGPFIGEPTDHVRISLNSGLCGLALSEKRTIQEDDVRNNERHIACSLATRSELVVPLKDEAGDFIAELDIDSNTLAAFTPELRKQVEDEAASFHELL